VLDVSTIHSLELIQNLEDPKSKQCFFGLLNETLTPMGARFLRTNILQPSTDVSKINARLSAVAELSTNQDMFFATRQGLLCRESLMLRTNCCNSHEKVRRC
jgi:DNA mismatch repair protein MSH4